MHYQSAQKNTIVSFLYLKIFLVLLLIFAIFSVGFKITNEISNSKFKNNSFTILLLGRNTYILNVDKSSKRYSFINFGSVNEKFKGKNALEMSLFVGAPIHAIIQDKEKQLTSGEDFLDVSYEMKLITQSSGVILTGLNAYDIYKFMNVARGVSRDNVQNETINSIEGNNDKILQLALKDTEIAKSNITIEIENGTNINGLGNIFSQMLTNGGYNVISIKSETDGSTSQIRYTEPINKGVLDSLQNITSFETKKIDSASIASVSIFLGDDLRERLSELFE